MKKLFFLLYIILALANCTTKKTIATATTSAIVRDSTTTIITKDTIIPGVNITAPKISFADVRNYPVNYPVVITQPGQPGQITIIRDANDSLLIICNTKDAVIQQLITQITASNKATNTSATSKAKTVNKTPIWFLALLLLSILLVLCFMIYKIKRIHIY
jgi:hypothetical protein